MRLVVYLGILGAGNPLQGHRLEPKWKPINLTIILKSNVMSLVLLHHINSFPLASPTYKYRNMGYIWALV
ncbi:hypothetical protein XENTR_v10002856 [Xenopus tropicalis]|nr:hypothetical protein XENTR_v10002856 [Xenopus tropicalis]